MQATTCLKSVANDDDIAVASGMCNSEDDDVVQEPWFLSGLPEPSPKVIAFFKYLLKGTPSFSSETFFTNYLKFQELSHLVLDNILSDDCNLETGTTIPAELFRYCPNLKILSLRNNELRELHPGVGRLKHLESLYLTNNRLQIWSIPRTLTFCSRLKSLYLDHNLLDALPGFLLEMKSLETVHRHGNHNYFKSTFMWYHTDVNNRILSTSGIRNSRNVVRDEVHMLCYAEKGSLQELATKTILSSNMDYFTSSQIPERLKSSLALSSTEFYICAFCSKAIGVIENAYRVFIFKNPYLGNTCVPFLHWACSIACAKGIEEPARVEQIESSREQDRVYAEYVRKSESQLEALYNPTKKRKKHTSTSASSSVRSISSCCLL